MQPLKRDDDAIISEWKDEILKNPNTYVDARVDKVKSKFADFSKFDDRLKHPQIQEDMISIVAQAIADATVLIAFQPTTDKKIHGLNVLIEHFKRYKKKTWQNVHEDMDDKIKKITAIDIFILMWRDLKHRLQASKRCVRASDCLISATFAPYEKLGGSRSKKRIKETNEKKKSRNKRNKRIIRRTRKSRF